MLNINLSCWHTGDLIIYTKIILMSYSVIKHRHWCFVKKNFGFLILTCGFVFSADYDEVDNFFGDLLEHLLYMLNKQQDKHSTQKQTTPVPHGLLKQTGRSISQDSCSEHISTKRLKTVDQSGDCSCDSLVYSTRPVCKVDSDCRRRSKSEAASSTGRKNQRNSSAGKVSSRILDEV